MAEDNPFATLVGFMIGFLISAVSLVLQYSFWHLMVRYSMIGGGIQTLIVMNSETWSVRATSILAPGQSSPKPRIVWVRNRKNFSLAQVTDLAPLYYLIPLNLAKNRFTGRNMASCSAWLIDFSRMSQLSVPIRVGSVHNEPHGGQTSTLTLPLSSPDTSACSQKPLLTEALSPPPSNHSFFLGEFGRCDCSCRCRCFLNRMKVGPQNFHHLRWGRCGLSVLESLLNPTLILHFCTL